MFSDVGIALVRVIVIRILIASATISAKVVLVGAVNHFYDHHQRVYHDRTVASVGLTSCVRTCAAASVQFSAM